jgi:hypothetical protein
MDAILSAARVEALSTSAGPPSGGLSSLGLAGAFAPSPGPSPARPAALVGHSSVREPRHWAVHAPASGKWSHFTLYWAGVGTAGMRPRACSHFGVLLGVDSWYRA